MVSGKILKQGTPRGLLYETSCPTLEDVFYKLCYEDESSMNELSKVKIEKEAKEKSLGLEWPGNRLVRGQKLGAGFNPIGALLFKNILSLKRHTVFMAFFVLMPIVSLLLFIACIGRMPHNVPLHLITVP